MEKKSQSTKGDFASPLDPPTLAEDRLLAALSYPFWYMAFPIFLLAPRFQQRPFIKYHVYQGLALGLLILWGGVTLWTTAAVLGKFGLFGLLLYPFLKLAEWGALLVTVYAAAGAWLGNRIELPYVTEFVRPFLHDRPKGNSTE